MINKKMVWFVTGVGIGTGVMFLFGTRGGKRARRQVVRMVEDGRDRVVEAGEEILDRGKELYQRGKGIAGETVHRMSESLHFAQR